MDEGMATGCVHLDRLAEELDAYGRDGHAPEEPTPQLPTEARMSRPIPSPEISDVADHDASAGARSVVDRDSTLPEGARVRPRSEHLSVPCVM
jgi:hypothetical protein